MRLLGEIIIAGLLIYIGWATPFRDYFPASISGVAKSSPAPAITLQPQPRPVVRSTSTPSGAWMWDANHHSALDRPTQAPHRP